MTPRGPGQCTSVVPAGRNVNDAAPACQPRRRASLGRRAPWKRDDRPARASGCRSVRLGSARDLGRNWAARRLREPATRAGHASRRLRERRLREPEVARAGGCASGPREPEVRRAGDARRRPFCHIDTYGRQGREFGPIPLDPTRDRPLVVLSRATCHPDLASNCASMGSPDCLTVRGCRCGRVLGSQGRNPAIWLGPGTDPGIRTLPWAPER